MLNALPANEGAEALTGSDEYISISINEYNDLTEKLKNTEIEKNKIARELRTIIKRDEIDKLNIETQIGLNRIITEEKLKQEMYVRLFLESWPDPMFIFDENAKFLLGTDSITGIIGVDDISILQGRELDSIIDRYRPVVFTEEITKLIKNIILSRDNVAIDKNIEILTETNRYELSILPFHKDNGDFAGVLVIMHDITEIIKAKEIAEHASSAKGEFLSRMSHEIRTPLNAILGMINIGMGTEDVDKKNYCFARADSASKHLLGVINDILDISKIEAEKFELSYSEFNFEHTLQNIINMANVRAEEKHQNFIVNLDEDVPMNILSDELRLSQVITNLLTNAIKFTPVYGTVTLSIKNIKEINNDFIFRIEVADSGIGISKEQQGRLFMSFNQADSNISQKFGGTGLGLAISKRIIELMGGEIWIESELGKGAKFIFTVKVKKAEGSICAKHKAAKHHCNFSNHTILIAEDVEINREIMASILEETGVHIDNAENGKTAVSMFKENPEKYSLILMDINMPEMNGYEATRLIRSLDVPKAKDIAIIAMTANVFKEDIEKCLASGMNSHTGKPIDADALFGVLEEYLK